MLPQPPRSPRKIIESCPTCGGPLAITVVRCESCGTEVHSHYQPCPFCRLTPEQMSFILLFVQSRGNLSEVEKALGVSYPTIRGKLDEIIRVVGAPAPAPAAPPAYDPSRDILARVAGGRLSPGAALAALRQSRGGRPAAERPAPERPSDTSPQIEAMASDTEAR
jgi:hypothetical protein